MRYYFHLHESGAIEADQGGVDLRDLAAARELAIQEARILMCSSIKAGRLNLDDYIEIANNAGTALSMIRFGDAVTVSGAPGTTAFA